MLDQAEDSQPPHGADDLHPDDLHPEDLRLSDDLHLSEDQLELYALGRLSEPGAVAVEEHLLVCDSCREGLNQAEAFALAMRTAITGEPASSAEANWFRVGKSLRRFAPAYAGALAAIVLLAVLYIRSGRSVAPFASIELTAMRGDMQSVKPARETDIILADAPVESGAPAEVVDATGGTVWSGVLQGDNHKVQIAKQLAPGNYFVRLYTDKGKLLHEYGFRVVVR